MSVSYEIQLREYEKAHKVWMETSVYGLDGFCRRIELFVKRNAYLRAYKQANPNHIVM